MTLETLFRLPRALSQRLGCFGTVGIHAAERQQLAALDSIACPSAALARLSADTLRAFFTDPALADCWRLDQQRIALLTLPEMTQGVNPGDQRALYYLVRALRPRAVLEIGTHIGCSTVNLAMACQAVGGTLLTVDVRDVNDAVTKPWRAYGASHSPRDLCKLIGCEDVVTFKVADSLAFLEAGTCQYDFIFLDGSHDAAHVYQEIPLALRRLTSGGCIVLHDYFPKLHPLWSNGDVIPGPWLAVQRLRREGATFVAQPLASLPWPTKLGSCVTSLAVLTE